VNVSVIIPAYNAAATIAETLESLLGQSSPDWQAIVVNDGSTDETAAVAEGFVEREARIQLVTQVQGGEAAARNTGIGLARCDWLLFLDSDDWILPHYLERMTGVLESDPRLDLVHCGWIRVAPDGQLSAEIYCLEPDHVFAASTRYCPFAVHACIVRRSLVEAVGGFDTSLRTCSDWDLWQRIARSGARFGAVGEALARYRMRANSAGMQAKQVLVDGLRVIERGHWSDPRVPHPDPSHANGLATNHLASAKLDFACWAAGLMLGQGKDARPLLRTLKGTREPDLDPDRVARRLFDAVLLPKGQTPAAWLGLWPSLQRRINEFLLRLEAQAKADGLARRARILLERLVLENSTAQWPLTIGGTHAVQIEVTEPIPDLPLPASVERVRCAVDLEGARLGMLDLPVCDGLVAGDVLADAIAAEFAWSILGRFFDNTVYRDLRIEPEATGRSLWRGALRLADGLAEDEPTLRSQVHQRVGWNIFLQEIWGCPDWPRERFDDPQPVGEVAPSRRVENGWLLVEVSEDLPDVDVSDGRLDLVVTVGGVALGLVTLPVNGGRVIAQELRAAITLAGGYELCGVAVREALLGRPLVDAMPLRDRLITAARAPRRDQGNIRAKMPPDKGPAGVVFAPGWERAVDRARPGGTPAVLLARHTHGRIGTSVSRRAKLPVAAAGELVQAASVAGEPVLQLHPRDQGPTRVVYAPDLLWRPLQPKPGEDVRPSEQTRSLLSLRLIDRTLVDVSRTRFPILMYHRVAPTGSAATARYRVTSEVFEDQLRYLRVAGFYSVALEDWQAAREANSPLPGRPLLITFDDGYLDFLTHAWPLLRRYGFSAMIFLVAEEVGGSNRWDHAYGEEVPLLGWKEICQLRDEGVEFGSHSARHPRLTGHSPEEIVREGARSRAILERGLGRPVTAFAYPHGDEDRVVQHLIGACGYIFGLSTRFALSTHDDPLLALPRIEVTGLDALPDFVSKIDGSRTSP
jgi:peptidoglycan/xylan/chitin deacetylase (PgdA/CDA1 family)